MTRIKAFGAALSVILALGAVAANAAIAHEWNLGGSKESLLESKGTLKFHDTFWQVEFTCEIGMPGAVSGGASFESVTNVNAKKCTQPAPFKEVQLTPVNISPTPWRVELVTGEGGVGVANLFTQEWLVTWVESTGGKIEERCEFPKNEQLTNETGGTAVRGSFSDSSRCEGGFLETRGTQTIKRVGGGALSVS